METFVEVQNTPYLQGASRLNLNPRASLDEALADPACPNFLQQALQDKVVWQKRNEFHVGQSLQSLGLAPQWVGALLAWGARVTLEDGSEHPLVELLETARKPGDIAQVSLPLDVPGRCWAAARTGDTPKDFPIVWAMAVIDLDDGLVKDARLALTGAWQKSVALTEAAEGLVGKPLDEENIQTVSAAVEKEVTPKGDYRGSVEYRSAMAGVMTRRALTACMEGENA